MKYISTFILCIVGNCNIWAQNISHHKKSEDLIYKTVFEVPTIKDKIPIERTPVETIWNSSVSINKLYDASNSKLSGVEKTIAVLFDGNNLIFSINNLNINPNNNLKKCYLSDELDLRNSPNLSIFLDPSHNHGVYYRFIIDANGHKQDLRVDDESWYTEWSVEIKKNNGNLNAEIKIPIEKLTEGVVDGDIWGFNITIDGIKDENTVSATPIKLNLANAQNFGHLLFKGDLNPEQLTLLEESIPNVHEKQQQDKLAENKAMCGPEVLEIDGELNNLSIESDIKLRNGTIIKCIGLDNDKIIRSNYPFFYEKYDNVQLQQLRKQYNLDEIIAPGKNDFEKLLLLNEWLYKHIEFGSPPPMSPNALEILQHGLNGQTFYCTYLSFTLMQMYTSLGFTARKLTSVSHGTLDVWSNYWRKWIQVDPSRHSYYRMKGKAVPLNSNEIRREYWKNKGLDMEMVYGTGQRAERVTLETREKDGHMRYRPDSYKWIAYKTRNNFFEIPFAYWNYDYLIVEDEYNVNQTWTDGNKTDIREVLGTRTNKLGDVFWTLNQAYIHLYDEGTNILKVQLETVTPNFETFEFVVDNDNTYKTEENIFSDNIEWHKTEPIFNWKLHKGQNFLITRSVNKFGVSGNEHKIVLNID